MGFVGPLRRERGREGGARASLTRLLEFTGSWQQVQQHRQAIPQALRALGGERDRSERKVLHLGSGAMATDLEGADGKVYKRAGDGLMEDLQNRELVP